jgi:hypothetical protein
MGTIVRINRFVGTIWLFIRTKVLKVPRGPRIRVYVSRADRADTKRLLGRWSRTSSWTLIGLIRYPTCWPSFKEKSCLSCGKNACGCPDGFQMSRFSKNKGARPFGTGGSMEGAARCGQASSQRGHPCRIHSRILSASHKVLPPTVSGAGIVPLRDYRRIVDASHSKHQARLSAPTSILRS